MSHLRLDLCSGMTFDDAQVLAQQVRDLFPTQVQAVSYHNPKPGLTAKQQRCLDVITEYIRLNGQAPRIVDLMALLNVGRPTVVWYLDALQERGYITRVHRKARNIRLVNSE